MSVREPYGVLFHRFWEGRTGRQIQARGCEAVVMATYLISCRHSNMIGLYELPLLFVGRELPCLRSEDRIVEALSDLDAVGFAEYDYASEYVWVREMARIRVSLAPGETISAGDLKHKAITKLYAAVSPNPFLGSFYQYYRNTLRLGTPRESTVRQQFPQAPSKPTGTGLQGASSVSVQDQKQLSGSGTTAAAPRDPSTDPNDNGNYRVIHRLAMDLLEQGSFESEGEFRSAVKDACAARRIDYGDHPGVDVDVVTRACSAALHRIKGRQIAAGNRQRARV